MITWTKADEAKPRVDTSDRWNEDNGVSIRVLAAFISTSTNSKHISFATYYHKSGNWTYDGFRGDAYVTIAWAAVNYPDLPEFQDITKTDCYRDEQSKNFDQTDPSYAKAVRSVLGDNDL